MNLELTEDQVALRDTVRQFLAEKASVAGHVRPLLDDPTGSTDAVWRGLANLGATGVVVPAEHDGAGMTMVEAGVVAEEMGAALNPGPWLSSAVASARALTRTGADHGLLAEIAGGTTIATVAPLTGARNGCADPWEVCKAARAKGSLRRPHQDGTGERGTRCPRLSSSWSYRDRIPPSACRTRNRGRATASTFRTSMRLA